MKKKIIVILSIFTLLFLSSCGSTPEEETVEPEAPVEIETPVEDIPVEETPIENEISQEEVDGFLAETNKARDRAIKAGAETKYPEELKKADEYFASIKNDNAALKNGYSKVIELYDSLTAKIDADNYKAKMMADIDSARAAAIKAGVEEYMPEDLIKLDNYVAAVKADEAKLIKEGADIPGYYQKLIELTDNIIMEQLEENIAASRERAVAAGVDKVIPDALKELDDYVETLKADEKLWKAEGPKVPAAYEELIIAMNNFKAEKKLLKDIEVSRNKAIKAGAETVTPEELKKLDDYFASLKNNTEAWQAEGNKVPGYYDLLTKFVNDKKIASNLLLNIKTSREKAVEAGAETKAADKLKVIDDYTALISKDSNSVKASGHKASNAYKALVAYVGALDAKQTIDSENLASYSQNVYDRASAKMTSVEEAYKDIESIPQSIISDATDARRDFRNVITVAYKEMAKAERELAYTEKKNADKVRAGVTQKERYKGAVESFKKGDSLYSMQDAKNAIAYYKTAKEEFTALHSDVSEEMLAALAAIEAAKKDVAESSQYAAEADEIAPIKSDNVEGIEDEDTVLLEADDYEDPAAAVIAVDDVVEVSEDAVVEEEPEELVADEQYVEKAVEETEETPAENQAEGTEDAETEPEDGTVTEQAENADDKDVTAEDEVTAPEENQATEDTESSETTETIPEETENSENIEESSEDETPVITDQVVTDSTAATEEKELSKDDIYDEVIAK